MIGRLLSQWHKRSQGASSHILNLSLFGDESFPERLNLTEQDNEEGHMLLDSFL